VSRHTKEYLEIRSEIRPDIGVNFRSFASISERETDASYQTDRVRAKCAQSEFHVGIMFSSALLHCCSSGRMNITERIVKRARFRNAQA